MTEQDVAARYHAAASGLTIPALLHRNATEFGDLPALTGPVATLTWRELAGEVAAVAHGLAGLGLLAGERMLMMMANRPEHWISDLAAAHLGAVPCTVYATLSPDQLAQLARHSGARILVIEGSEQLDRWRPVLNDLPTITHVIVVEDAARPAGDLRFVSWRELRDKGATGHAAEPSVFEHTWRQVQPEQPVTLLYTSGTTGDPKGVLLSHHSVIYSCVMLTNLVPDVPAHPRSVAYLPLAHIAERMLGIYLPVYKAGHVNLCADVTAILASLLAVRPPSLFGVPRVWEKMVAGISGMLPSLPPEQRTPVEQAINARRQAYLLRAEGRPVPEDLATAVERAEQHVLRPLRAKLGLDNMVWPGSGAAPISYETLSYLGGLGLDILEVWGMTETSGVATSCTRDAYAPGTVGRVVPGVELKIADDGEIFVRGPIVCLGYLRTDGGIDPATDADGWLPTGDVGTLDDAGFLTITDRKKEIIITAGGHNIAPTSIERRLRTHPLIGQAVAIGDRRPYPVALIVLDEEAAPLWAAAQGIEAKDIAELAAHPAVVEAVTDAVNQTNAQLSRAEQVKKFRILSDAWGLESPELTPKMSLRRQVIAERHAALIDELYA